MKPVFCSLVRAALKRFAEALQRSRRPVSAVSLVRAHPPYPPGACARATPPGFARARALQRSAQAKPEGMGPPDGKPPPRPAGTAANQDRLCLACPVYPGATTGRVGGRRGRGWTGVASWYAPAQPLATRRDCGGQGGLGDGNSELARCEDAPGGPAGPGRCLWPHPRGKEMTL